MSASYQYNIFSKISFNKKYYLLSTKAVDNFVDDSNKISPNVTNNKAFRYFAYFLVTYNINYIQ